MHFTENLKQALLTLRSNKLRSILTMLGIIMGVFSVVAIMAISNATKSFMTQELNKMGANTVIIQMNSSEAINVDDLLTLDDLDYILKGVDEVAYAASSSTMYSYLKLEDEEKAAYVTGISSQFSSFQEVKMTNGRTITPTDVEQVRRVAVIQDSFANEYFGSVDVLGEELKLYNYYGEVMKVKIIGVSSSEDEMFSSMMSGMNRPVYITMPITTTQQFFGEDTIDQIQVSAKEGADLRVTGEKVVRLLEFTHKNQDKYMATTIEDIQKSVGSILGVISSVLLVIAVITLVVGGIGIINILLVSVTERIREIGLRKALGAKKRDIVVQFLTESIMMTGFSGTIGIVLGLIIGMVISSVIKIPPVVDVKSMVLALMGSLILGLIFGVYPAVKAADLDPIESLRYE